MPTIQVTDHSNIQRMNMNHELDTYEKILGEAALISSDRIFTNSGKDHAAIAMSLMYNHTREKMQLVVDNFNGAVSNNPKYTDALEKCLNRGVKAEVLILNTPNRNSEGFKLFHKFRLRNPEQVIIKQAVDKTKEILKEARDISHINVNELYNIALFDNDKYRFEIKPSKFNALLSFSDSKLVAKYRIPFTNAFQTAIELA
jgi:hypothetical protein